MGSERTIVFSLNKKEKASLKWHTGAVRSLYYDHENVRKAYRELVKPYLVCNENTNTRNAVNKLVYDHIKSGKVSTMFDFVNLITALRLTEIDETATDDEGDYLVHLILAPIPVREKYTWWNIAWHMNHHCRQLWRCCFVQVKRPHWGTFAMAYTNGEGYDKADFFLDKEFEKDKKENIENYKKYCMKRKGE